ncbi:MAG: hypothetical protein [aquatic viral metagenome]
MKQKNTRMVQVKLPIQDIASEALKYPEIIKTLKANLKNKDFKNGIIVIPKHIGELQVVPDEYMEVFKAASIIVKDDEDVLHIDFDRLQKVKQSDTEIKQILTNVAEKYGLDITTLLKQVESIRVMLGLGE